MPNAPEKTTTTVWLFATASFLHDIGADMIFSVWPFFLTNVLGVNKSVVGLIDGIGDTLVSLSQAGAGYLSDRLRKRKVFVWMGYLFGSVARIGYALAPTWQWVIPFRMLDRSGKMRSTPRDAIVAEISTRENRGRHFGILRMMDNSGAVLGIVLSLLLIGRLGYRTLFLLAAIPSVLAVLLVLIAYRERKGPDMLIFRGIRVAHWNANLKLYFLLSAIFELGSFSYSFLLLYAHDTGIAATKTPLLYLLFTVIAASLSLPFGKLADRIGRKPVMLFSFACWGATTLLLVIDSHPLVIIAAFALYGTHKAALDPVQRTMLAELAPPAFVASTMGAFQLATGVMSLPASLIAGVLWDTIGSRAPLLLSLGLTCVAAVLLLAVRETGRSQPRS
ncbi:MAG: MFS transporter [Candidatus Peregrinibacteria bacterium]|nr:MFS transporter [Candidatus Peregrinibacteria bacterium]